MAPHVQALLLQAVPLMLASTLMDGGTVQMGVVLGGMLFWVTVSLLFLRHGRQVTRFDQHFVRWGSVPFLVVGVFVWQVIEPFLHGKME